MNTIVISTILLIINFTDFIYANPNHKKEPLGFQGTRGRRSVENVHPPDGVDDNYSIHNQKNDNEALSHDDVTNVKQHVGVVAIAPAAKLFQASTESILNTLVSKDSNAPRNIVKRAPSLGFQGMRGKKDSEMPDKRYTLGFQGVRGKKFLFNYPHRLSYYSPKRAPSGFMGMRGKKEVPSVDSSYMLNLLNAMDDLTNLDPKLYQILLNNDMLSRLYNDDDTTSGDLSDSPTEEEKRAENFELIEAINDIDHALEYEKRAPYGFVGMRGKRAPVGFMGMRGKKDDLDGEYLSHYDEKRGPLTGFFGTRGKKQPYNSGFFGTRGKKFPYGFGNKFIGVRGKKDSTDGIESNMIDDESIENPMNKRKPSGFVGMRGKKDSDTLLQAED